MAGCGVTKWVQLPGKTLCSLGWARAVRKTEPELPVKSHTNKQTNNYTKNYWPAGSSSTVQCTPTHLPFLNLNRSWAHIFRQFYGHLSQVYPGNFGQTPYGWRIFLFLDDFLNTPGKVANPLDTQGGFSPRSPFSLIFILKLLRFSLLLLYSDWHSFYNRCLLWSLKWKMSSVRTL